MVRLDSDVRFLGRRFGGYLFKAIFTWQWRLHISIAMRLLKLSLIFIITLLIGKDSFVRIDSEHIKVEAELFRVK